MPSGSPRQKKFMRIAAHDAGFAKEAGISQTVAREFYRADQRQALRKSIHRAINTVKNRKATR